MQRAVQKLAEKKQFTYSYCNQCTQQSMALAMLKQKTVCNLISSDNDSCQCSETISKVDFPAEDTFAF